MAGPEFRNVSLLTIGTWATFRCIYDITMQEQKFVTKIVKNYHFEWLRTPITFVMFDVEPGYIHIIRYCLSY